MNSLPVQLGSCRKTSSWNCQEEEWFRIEAALDMAAPGKPDDER